MTGRRKGIEIVVIDILERTNIVEMEQAIKAKIRNKQIAMVAKTMSHMTTIPIMTNKIKIIITIVTTERDLARIGSVGSRVNIKFIM